MNRRNFISLAGMSSLVPFHHIMAENAILHHHKIGICDWHIQSGGDPKAFQLASEFGLDGIQLTYQPLHEKNNLTDKEVRKNFLAESKKHKVEIASMAMGIFNHQPFATDPNAELWVNQCMEIMIDLKQKIVLLAFFGNGDIKDKPDMQKSVIERLKKLTPFAEKNGLTLGLETWLNKEEHMHILDAVGSDSVKVYYDTANMDKMGYNVAEEIRWLGKKNAICQIHMKENITRLGQGSVNFPDVKKALQDIHYSDWLIIEAAVKDGWKESAIANGIFLNELFNPEK